GQPAPAPDDRRAEVRVRHLRGDPALRDALPAARAHPGGTAEARVRAGRRGPAPLRRDCVMADLLTAPAVRKEFGRLVAVTDVDFIVPERKVISLIGPNGAGKTTFFNMLTGVYKPTAGTIVFNGEDV